MLTILGLERCSRLSQVKVKKLDIGVNKLGNLTPFGTAAASRTAREVFPGHPNLRISWQEA